MASNVDSLSISVAPALVTLDVSLSITSGHWPTGISVTAMYATHWAAELGLFCSVPRAPSTWKSNISF